MHEKCKSLFCFLTCNPYFFFFIDFGYFASLTLYYSYVIQTHVFRIHISTPYIPLSVDIGVEEREQANQMCVRKREMVYVHISIKQNDPSRNRVQDDLILTFVLVTIIFAMQKLWSDAQVNVKMRRIKCEKMCKCECTWAWQ